MRLAAAAILALAVSCRVTAAEELEPLDSQQRLPGREIMVEPEAPARSTAQEPPPAAGLAGAAKDAAGCIAGPTVDVDPAMAPLHLGAQTYPQTLKLCDRRVVLTFDDGPSPETTPLVLKALREAGVHANFFLIGRNSCRHPALARQEMEEGHVVGHHSNTHPSFTLRGFDNPSARRDIENGIAADEAAIYGAGANASHPHVPFFRFPGFADTKPLLSYLDGRGIAVFGSDLWAGDWIAMTPEHERRRILDALEERPHRNGIILFHDTRMSTARMLPELLRDLKSRGYGFVQITYRQGAQAPGRVDGPPGLPLTERVISRLHTPIVPGQHRLASGPVPGCAGDAGVVGEVTQP